MRNRYQGSDHQFPNKRGVPPHTDDPEVQVEPSTWLSVLTVALPEKMRVHPHTYTHLENMFGDQVTVVRRGIDDLTIISVLDQQTDTQAQDLAEGIADSILELFALDGSAVIDHWIERPSITSLSELDSPRPQLALVPEAPFS